MKECKKGKTYAFQTDIRKRVENVWMTQVLLFAIAFSEYSLYTNSIYFVSDWDMN